MTIFSRIIAGEIPSYKIAENEKFYAFLDISPLREGHVLVVPKTETDQFFDMTDEYRLRSAFSKPIAKAIERSLPPATVAGWQWSVSRFHTPTFTWFPSTTQTT